MRYHYKKPTMPRTKFGRRYICNHPVYSFCTLYEQNGKGLAVIQQRFEPETKSTIWTEIDPYLTDSLYLNPGFQEYFDGKAKNGTYDGLFPTVTIRQIMWALKMKPLPKQPWETVFDHSPI